MKTILVLLAVASASYAQQCDNSFGAYLNALKDQIGHAQGLEPEYRDDYYKLVRKCFATSTDDANRCALTDDEVKGDVYGDSGPLKDCSRCQQLVKGLRDKFMGSDEKVRKCFRGKFAQAIREELEPCIQGKISNGYSFKVPPIPDFDENSFSQIQTIEQGIDYRIAARSRLEACNKVNPQKYQSTSPCMENGFPGIYAKHCQAAKAARNQAVQGSCGPRFNEVKKATCECMIEKRDDWHSRFTKVQGVVDSATNAHQCGLDISSAVGSWMGKLQSAIDECLPKDGTNKQTNLATLIELGCGQVINGGVKKSELTTGFRFIRLFLDALNDRLTIYCDKNCSF